MSNTEFERPILNNSHEWVKTLDHLLDNGDLSKPRDHETKEVLFHNSWFDMRTPVLMIPERKIGLKFMAAEAAWIMEGNDKVDKIAPYSNMISKFSDDGVSFFGAYGPKIVSQLEYVVDTLAVDQDSRQAVINIWRENPGKSKDIPCTISVQFLIRHGRLFCSDNMRSSDIWLGHPYDTFNFSMLAGWVILELKARYDIHIELGYLNLYAGSKHIYSNNFEAAAEIVSKYLENPGTIPDAPVFDPHKFSGGFDLQETLWLVADSENGVLEEGGLLWE